MVAKGIATAARHGRQRAAGKASSSRRLRFNQLRCWEAVALREVDDANGIIKGVKIVGTKSRNGRRYTMEALVRAIPLYEGAAVNIDHPRDDPDEQRSSYDRFGVIKNVRKGADGLYGDLHYLKSHRMANSVVEDAKRGLNVFGMSHNASGDGFTEDDGTRVIDRILEVRHVDLVADPATTNSLFESRNHPRKRRPRMAGVTDPKDVSVLEDMDTNPLLGGPDVEEEEEPGWDDQLGELVKSIMCDPKLDKAVKRAKILSALKLMDEDDSGGGDDTEESEEDDEEDEEEDDDDKDYKEGLDAKALRKLARHTDPAVRKLTEAFDAAQTKTAMQAKRAMAVELCRKAKLPKEARSPIFMEGLYRASGKKEMVQLIKDRRSLLESKRPRSQGAGGGMPELDAKTLVKTLKQAQ
jgi:hypothetical protein